MGFCHLKLGFGFILGKTWNLSNIYNVGRRGEEGPVAGCGGTDGQMNSTCRGEGEGLNCKTRRQRSRVLKAYRGAVSVALGASAHWGWGPGRRKGGRGEEPTP